jgi:hypothetical protein
MWEKVTDISKDKRKLSIQEGTVFWRVVDLDEYFQEEAISRDCEKDKFYYGQPDDPHEAFECPKCKRLMNWAVQCRHVVLLYDATNNEYHKIRKSLLDKIWKYLKVNCGLKRKAEAFAFYNDSGEKTITVDFDFPAPWDDEFQEIFPEITIFTDTDAVGQGYCIGVQAGS